MTRWFRKIAYFRSILGDEYLVMKIIKDEMKEIKAKIRRCPPDPDQSGG